MKKLLTVVFATLFAASTGAFAAGHMKGEKDAKGAKTEKQAAKGDKKGGDKKASAQKTSAQKTGDKKGKGAETK